MCRTDLLGLTQTGERWPKREVISHFRLLLDWNPLSFRLTPRSCAPSWPGAWAPSHFNITLEDLKGKNWNFNFSVFPRNSSFCLSVYLSVCQWRTNSPLFATPGINSLLQATNHSTSYLQCNYDLTALGTIHVRSWRHVRRYRYVEHKVSYRNTGNNMSATKSHLKILNTLETLDYC